MADVDYFHIAVEQLRRERDREIPPVTVESCLRALKAAHAELQQAIHQMARVR